jgi:hypothetical protein
MSILGPFDHRPPPVPPTGSLYRVTRALQLGPLGLEAGAEVRQLAPQALDHSVAPTTDDAVIATPVVADVRRIAGE